MIRTYTAPSLATAAVLSVLEISQWTARKKDKRTAEEVATAKNAKSRATSVNKNLFVDCAELMAIASYAAETRLWFNSVTLPWDDRGTRIVPSMKYMDIACEMSTRIEKFNALVQKFLSVYHTEITKQAFSLGDLFDRAEYPSLTEVSRLFSMRVETSPVPTAGDFRVDIASDISAQLRAQFEEASRARIAQAMQEAWGRLREKAEHIRERMQALLEFDPNAQAQETPEEAASADDAPGGESETIKKKRRPKLYASLLDNALQLCDTMRDLNVLDDPDLENARCELLHAIRHLDVKSLKESPELQQTTKQKMEALLDKMPW